MIDINELRDRAVMFGSDYLTDEEWVAVIDRLEAAEKAATEAYQRGYATGQEEIAAELEFAKREVANLHDDISEWMDKCDALRAKIESMERQEPVAWIVRGGYPVPLDTLEWQLWYGSEKPTLSWVNQETRPLYALPGAQPAPSVPDEEAAYSDWFNVEKNVAYDGVGAFVKAAWMARAALAAAPEAKP